MQKKLPCTLVEMAIYSKSGNKTQTAVSFFKYVAAADYWQKTEKGMTFLLWKMSFKSWLKKSRLEPALF